MSDNGADDLPHGSAGRRLRKLRDVKGFSRRELAEKVGVDISSIVNWESGKHLPRDRFRARLASALECDVNSLLVADKDEPTARFSAALVDTDQELPRVLNELTRATRRTLRTLRFAAPYATTPYIQTEWRRLVYERLLSGTLEVQRVEIFYDLKRLQETLSNIIRYNGCRYYVKSFCPGLGEVAPFMGGYFFDDDEFLLGAYWTGLPPLKRPGLRVSGNPFRAFYNEYWDAIWQRGVWLNNCAAHDFSNIRALAEKLGLPPEEWETFLAQAKNLTIGDGAPPLV